MIRKSQRNSLFAVLLVVLFGCFCPAAVSADEIVRTEVSLERETGFYPGREVGMEIEMRVPNRLQPEIAGAPELELDNARLVDFSPLEQPFPGFYEVREEQREKEGREYTFFIFSTRIVPPAPGALAGSGEVPLSLLETEGWPAAVHPLFERRVGGWLSVRRREEILTEFELPQKEVEALPSLPPDGRFLGLVGDWQIEAGLDRESAALNEAVELTMVATGEGAPEFSQPSELELRGFEVRGPEIDRERLNPETGRVTASWWLTPIEVTASLENFVWLTFSPIDEEYVEHVFSLDLTVLAAPPPVEEPAVLPSVRVSPLQRQFEAGMKRPWWREGLAVTLIFVLAGAAGLAFTAVQVWRRNIRAKLGEAGLKREQALKRRRKLLKKLEKADAEQLAGRMKEDVVPWLLEVLQMAPGTTAEELAEEVQEKEPELAEMLKVVEHVEYDPRLKKNLDKEKMISRLRRFSLFVSLFVFLLTGLNVFQEEASGASMRLQTYQIANNPNLRGKDSGAPASPRALPLCPRGRGRFRLRQGSGATCHRLAGTLALHRSPRGRGRSTKLVVAQQFSSGLAGDEKSGGRAEKKNGLDTSVPMAREEDPASVFGAAIEAYERGDFRRAEKLFAELERVDEVNSTLLYNRGNCAWYQEEPWRALVLYERARRAAPRDMRIRNNLDLVRQHLNLPAIGSNDGHFIARLVKLRDYLRPDEWLRLAAAGLAGLGVIACWRAWRGRRITGAGPVLAGLLLVLFITALAAQLTSTYRPHWQGVVLQDIALRAAPSSAARQIGSLSAVGREVVIQEQHLGWVRVRSSELEGWLPQAEVASLWGAGWPEGEVN